MNRWTKRNADGEAFINAGYYTSKFNEAVECFARYEDLKEEGLLVELPCKIGDTVYVVGSKCLAGIPSDAECIKVEFCKDCIYERELVVFEATVDRNILFMIMFGDENENFIMNKTAFFTKEEADAKLAELKR